jgi:hypothetical protein
MALGAEFKLREREKVTILTVLLPDKPQTFISG